MTDLLAAELILTTARTTACSMRATSGAGMMYRVRYTYQDAAGAVTYTVVRTPPKVFTVEAADGTPLPDPIPEHLRVLYRLPELIAAPPGDDVYIAEGEKDADTLAAAGLVATTAPFGTRGGWLDSYTAHLVGRHVLVLPDADGPGRRYGQVVAQALTGHAATVTVVDLHHPRRGPWDVTDWMAPADRDASRLLRRVADARYAAAGVDWASKTGRREARVSLAVNAPLPAAEKLLLLVLAPHLRDDQGQRLPPVADLARRCGGAHRVTAARALAGLRRRGVLTPGPVGRIRWDILAALVANEMPQ